MLYDWTRYLNDVIKERNVDKKARPNLLDIMTDSKLPFTDNRGKMRKAAAFRFRIFAPVLQKRALLSVGPIRLEPSSLDSEVVRGK